MITQYAHEICRWWVFVALAAAAWGKLLGLKQFKNTLAKNVAIASKAPGLAAGAIIGAEVAIAVAIAWSGDAWRTAMSAALALLVLFSLFIARVVLTGDSFVCNCFGASTRRVSSHDVARNLLLTGAAAFAWSTEPAGAAAPPLAGVALFFVGFMLFLVSTSLHEITFVWRRASEV